MQKLHITTLYKDFFLISEPDCDTYYSWWLSVFSFLMISHLLTACLMYRYLCPAQTLMLFNTLLLFMMLLWFYIVQEYASLLYWYCSYNTVNLSNKCYKTACAKYITLGHWPLANFTFPCFLLLLVNVLFNDIIIKTPAALHTRSQISDLGSQGLLWISTSLPHQRWTNWIYRIHILDTLFILPFVFLPLIYMITFIKMF